GNLVAADFGVVVGVGQIDVELAVLGKVRIERQAEQAAFADGADLSGKVEKPCQGSRPQVEDVDLAGALDDVEMIDVTRRRRGKHRLAQPGRDTRRGNRGDIGLRTVRVEAVDQIVAGAPLQGIGTIGAIDLIYIAHDVSPAER